MAVPLSSCWRKGQAGWYFLKDIKKVCIYDILVSHPIRYPGTILQEQYCTEQLGLSIGDILPLRVVLLLSDQNEYMDRRHYDKEPMIRRRDERPVFRAADAQACDTICYTEYSSLYGRCSGWWNSRTTSSIDTVDWLIRVYLLVLYKTHSTLLFWTEHQDTIYQRDLVRILT